MYVTNPDLYAELFDKSCDGMLLLKAGRFIECNEAAAAMLGYRDKSELLMRTTAEISPEFQPGGESSSQKSKRMMAIAGKEGNNRFEWLYRKADGSEMWVEVMLTEVVLGEEAICFAIWRDIQSQKVAQAELKKERERLALALEATGFEIWENDFESGRVTQPDRIYKKAGYEPGEVPTNFEEVKALIHPEDIAPAFEAISRHLEGGSERYAAEFRFRKKEGGWMWLANYGRVYEKNSAGVPLKFIGLTLDITEKKETELALERLNHELEQRVIEATEKRMEQEKLIVQQSKMALMGEMIGIIAHQWKQPLSVLGMLADDLKDAYAYEELDGEYMDDFNQKTHGQIEFMSQTVDSFRGFLRPSREIGYFGVVNAVRETVGLLERMLYSRGIHVDMRVMEDGDDRITGFENEFKQVILNILSNAKDAYESSGGSGNKQIGIDIVNEGGMISVGVRDFAGGIDGAVIGKIFDPYVTTKGSAGTGIGLNISKTIIERMNGELTVVNHDRGGALFMIRLPVATE